jgi:anti-sigma regulatory factor (Ser/Thr protein kinase)
MAMSLHPQHSISVTDRSSIGEVRRFATLTADRAKMKEAELGRVSLITTELATNLFLHATGGAIIIRMLPIETGPGIEIIALDRGPGITDVRRCLADGYSSTGTRGCGLGAIQRLSTEFDIYSAQPTGTIVMSRLRSIDRNAEAEAEFSVISLPAPGETECGDGWQVRLVGNKLAAIVVDGLGHGPLAAEAAAKALTVFDEGRFDTPVTYLESAQSAMTSTRGAALALAQADLNRRSLHYAAVGNIAGSLFGSGMGKRQSLYSHNGIVGGAIRKLQQFDYQWRDDDLLIMHSDGLTDRWNLNNYPGLARADTGVIAAVLYRDAKRGQDDATILVARLKAS